jgi:hypothetical protein
MSQGELKAVVSDRGPLRKVILTLSSKICATEASRRLYRKYPEGCPIRRECFRPNAPIEDAQRRTTR